MTLLTPEAPIFLPLYSVLLVLYVAGVAFQLRRLRPARGAATA